jgi:type IV secretion system protein VirD4
LTVAPTRSGKGTTAIIPNLLTYEGSALVIDPKGENAMITAERRVGLKQEVLIVDPWGITGLEPIARFNPLDWLDPNDPDVSENAMMLADAIVVSNPNSREPFWDEEAKALLRGIILYVALNEQGPNRTLGSVRDIIVASKNVFEAFLNAMVASNNEIVRTTATRTFSKEEKLRSSIMAQLQSHTHFLDSPRIRESLSHSDFKFEELKTSKITVYLVLPADRLATFGRWLRLLVQQAITVNARNIGVQPKKPILFVLDEMAALGHLTMVEQAYGLMAGFGMQLWGIVQDLSQLKAIYGKSWETFIGNSGVLQYFGSRDRSTAEYFSALCGDATITKASFSRSIARAFGSSGSTSVTDGTSWDAAQRKLMYPDELMVMHGDGELLIVENLYPIRGSKQAWFDHPQLKKLGVNLHEAAAQQQKVEAAKTTPN